MEYEPSRGQGGRQERRCRARQAPHHRGSVNHGKGLGFRLRKKLRREAWNSPPYLTALRRN
ncbi:hypothetical protein Cadr_000001963 [Camelus dromedarius]|uniref:Uncharacterized protein n=1 Tax=Camelus dromedarius TaxID=9838 RepID=A0A5N4EFJ5_CAMDR|nr:hypothetical protein Cadr_000001963 [Camelus dromedarius]